MHADGSRISMAWGRFYFVAVFVAYCGAEFLLGRWTALSLRYGANVWPLARPLAISLPLLAWIGYWLALFLSPYLRPRSTYRQCGLLVLAFAGVFFSSWLWMFLLANIYGT